MVTGENLNVPYLDLTRGLGFHLIMNYFTRMVAYKCYNYNADYEFGGPSQVRYFKEDGYEYLKGVTCNFQPGWPGSGGSKTRAKVFCSPYKEFLQSVNLFGKESGSVTYRNTVRAYVDCGEGYQVARFSCSTSNSKFQLAEEWDGKDKYWGTKSMEESDAPNWKTGWGRNADEQYRRYDRYAFCVYENKSWGAWISKQSTTVTVTGEHMIGFIIIFVLPREMLLTNHEPTCFTSSYL